MADMLAIVSKAVFEKLAGKSPKLGTVLGMAAYVSANKNLEHLAEGGRLFLVTVRPPDEALWLVAVLDHPTFDGAQWLAQPSHLPVTDITALRGKLVFASGKGITAGAGALGMSLQTPRVLADTDVAHLLGTEMPVAPLAQLETGNRDRKNALLQAILDEPDSDLARQVFADERLLHLDPRGELILTELALARPLSIRKRVLLEARRTALLEEHGAAWFPYKLEASKRRGGFLASATGTLKQLDVVLASEPVDDLTVTSVDGLASVKKLLQASWLPRIRSLTIRGSLGDDGFAALVGAASTQQLTRLNVTSTGIHRPVLGAHLPELSTLVLTANVLKDAGAIELAKWQHLAQARVLYLSKTGLTSKGLTALLAASLPGLTKLTLSGNNLGSEGAQVIAANAKRLPNLVRLEAIEAKLDAGSVGAIAAAKLPRLTLLDVRGNRLKVPADPRVRV